MLKIKRTGKQAGRLDCTITFRDISPGFLFILETQISNIINAQTKQFEGPVLLSGTTEIQIKSLEELISLRDELKEEIVKIKNF